jgi:hypothetical protein
MPNAQIIKGNSLSNIPWEDKKICYYRDMCDCIVQKLMLNF